MGTTKGPLARQALKISTRESAQDKHPLKHPKVGTTNGLLTDYEFYVGNHYVFLGTTKWTNIGLLTDY